jgi:cyclophilin family peptidyl-prolyl cis-trans isomerase
MLGALALLATAGTLAVLSLAAAPAGSSQQCGPVVRPAPKPDGGRQPPRQRLDPRKRYDVILATNCGSFTIRLDVRTSPRTTASFVALMRSGFFNRTIFHRIVPGFVIQGGDPTGRGSGGPGYTVVDRPPPRTVYTRYVVAMAKTAADPPGTSGSQFFVVTGTATHLPADYALLGKVTAGRRVVDRIGRLGDPATQRPTRVIVLERARVRVS